MMWQVASGGCVFRRDCGNQYIGYSFRFHARDPAHVELLAVKKGLELAKEFGLKNIQVEIDAHIILQMIKEVKSYKLHNLGMLLQEVAGMLSHYDDARLLHVKRAANSMAHKLAKYRLKMQDTEQTHVVPPGVC